MQVKIINKFGNIIGWNRITPNVLGRDVEGITSISYKDSQEMNNEYGAGEYPVGQSQGNYTAEASFTFYKEELIALQKSLPKLTRLQDIPAFDIPVVYEYDAMVYKDVIRNCRFKNNGVDVKQNDGKILTQMDLLVSHIDWNM